MASNAKRELHGGAERDCDLHALAPWNQRAEFITTESSEERTFRHDSLKAPRNLGKELIADIVAQLIINRLEAI